MHCFAKSKSMDLNDFLIDRYALNIRLLRKVNACFARSKSMDFLRVVFSGEVFILKKN